MVGKDKVDGGSEMGKGKLQGMSLTFAPFAHPIEKEEQTFSFCYSWFIGLLWWAFWVCVSPAPMPISSTSFSVPTLWTVSMICVLPPSPKQHPSHPLCVWWHPNIHPFNEWEQGLEHDMGGSVVSSHLPCLRRRAGGRKEKLCAWHVKGRHD